LPVNVLPIAQAPEEAIAWFRARVPVTKPEWRKLEDRARRRAFTVAGVAQLDLISEVWEAIDRAVANGETLDDFRRAVGPKLASAWGGANPYRVETIYRTNVQMAYQAGRFKQLTEPAVLKGRPFWIFDSVLDANTTKEICLPRNGTVLPAEHEWWLTNYPPLHFRCRSGVRSLTRKQAEERGITETPSDAKPAAGFGLAPHPEEWDRGWAVGVQESVLDRDWVPAIKGDVPGPAAYDRPALIPVDPMPVKVLPSMEEAGEETFRKELAEAWGGEVVTVQDPTGIGVILSADLLTHLKPDGRERFLSLLPDVIANPFEVWLMPLRDTTTGTIAFRRRYIKRYRDKRNRNVLFIAEMQKGVWTGYTMLETRQAKGLEKQRVGFLRWGRD
jgi:hypothetical protein